MIGFVASPGTGANPGDPWDLSQYFRDFEVVPLDPVLTAADLDTDGKATFHFYGRSFDVVVEPAPWPVVEGVGHLKSDGTVVVEPLAFPHKVYVGTFEGIAGTRVLVTITEVGVAGYIDDGADKFEFYPVKTHNEAAPHGLSVVYPAAAAIFPDLSHVEPELPDEIRLPAAPPLGGNGPEASHEPGPDRVLTMHADSDMRRSSTTWLTRVSNAYYALNDNFRAMAGYGFTLAGGVIYSCADEACDTSWGTNTADTGDLLVAWGPNVRDSNPSSFDLGALTTGHDLTGAQGAAWQSGRYGVTDAVGISDTVYAKVLAHEVGHNFNGDHGKRSGTFPGRATSYQHDHGFNHVHCSVPTVLGICPPGFSSNHWHSVWYTHWEIMNYPGSSSTDEWVYELGNTGTTTSNYYWVRSCNYNSWTEGTKDSQNDPGTGFYCTN